MIKYLNCDCINSKCSAIVNQVNLSGNMDFHTGLEYSIRFPMMYEDYLQRYHQKKLKLNETYLFTEDRKKIINFVCYESYAFSTTLETIEKTLKHFVKHYMDYGLKEVAFPLLGCEEDGLRMVNVLPIMELYLKPLPIDCYICFDVEGPSNLELQMITAFKEANFEHLKTYADLDEIQMVSLELNKENINRFEEIYHIKGINANNYRLIYQYFYNGEYKKLNPFYQESLF